MKIYDQNGLPKDSSSSSGSEVGHPLASGFISPLATDTDGIALNQALGVLADTDAIAVAQASTATVPLTLEPAAATLLPARQITLTSAFDLSLVNYEIQGLDSSGGAQSEIVAGPNVSTVLSVNYYSSVTSITPDASDANNVEAGWPNSDAAFPLELIDPSAIFSPTRRVTLTSTDNLSAVNFEITGTDEDDSFQSETVIGPNNTTVSGVLRYKTVTSIAPDGFPDDSVMAGWQDETVALYQVPAGLSANLTHFYLLNTGVVTQTVYLYLRISGAYIPWKVPLLFPDEDISLLGSEPALPLDAGDAIFATSTTSGVVSYSIHGRE